MQVKNVKSFVGREGYGFNANLYLSGKKLAFAIDDASGGGVNYQWEGSTTEEKLANQKLAKDFVDAHPPELMDPNAEAWVKTLYTDGKRKLDLDELVTRLVDQFENDKNLNRKKKTSVPFTTPACASGNYFVMKHNGDIEGTKAFILKKHPDATFL
jgi:hypothetical protein